MAVGQSLLRVNAPHAMFARRQCHFSGGGGVPALVVWPLLLTQVKGADTLSRG